MRVLLLSFCVWFAVHALEEPIETGPSPAETLCLEYINRLRADPSSESERLLVGAQGGISGIYAKVDFEKCRQEVAQLQAVPPLVFNRALIKSARAHARYMIHHNMTTHDEINGKEYFSGARPFQRMRVAAYAGTPLMENAYLRAVSPWNSHCGFIIDWGPSPDGMQPGRGHRMTCVSPMAREIGIAALPHDRQRFQSTCHNLGNNYRVARFVGGVFFNDMNKNNFYDLGEGVGGIHIEADSGESCTTWASGAYTLALNHQDSVRISVRLNDYTASWNYPAGVQNIRCAGVCPNQADQVYVQSRLALAASVKPIDIWWQCRGRFKTQEQASALEAIAGQQLQQLQRDQFELLRSFSVGRESAFKKVFSKISGTYTKTKAMTWFTDAKKAMPVYADVKSLVEKIRQRKALRLGEIEKHMSQLKRCVKKLKHSDFQQILQEQYYLLSRTVAQQ